MANTNITEWSVDDVCSWLYHINLGEHVDMFRANEVDGRMLLILTMEDITEELGLSKLQAKKVIHMRDTSQGAGGETPPVAPPQPNEQQRRGRKRRILREAVVAVGQFVLVRCGLSQCWIYLTVHLWNSAHFFLKLLMQKNVVYSYFFGQEEGQECEEVEVQRAEEE